MTQRLADAGLITPSLLATETGRPSSSVEGAVWRVLTHVDGVSFDVVGGAGQARAAGALVARFHAALDGLDHAFVGMRAGVHDTPPHLARLDEAVAAHAGTAWPPRSGRWRAAIRAGAAALPPLPALAAARLPRRSQVQQHPVRGHDAARRRARRRA